MIKANATILVTNSLVGSSENYVIFYLVYAESAGIGGGQLLIGAQTDPGAPMAGVTLLFTDTVDVVHTKLINHAVQSCLLFNPPVTITNLDSIVIWGFPGLSVPGPQGLQGIPGPEGPQGIPGPQGDLGNITVAVTCDCKKD